MSVNLQLSNGSKVQANAFSGTSTSESNTSQQSNSLMQLIDLMIQALINRLMQQSANSDDSNDQASPGTSSPSGSTASPFQSGSHSQPASPTTPVGQGGTQSTSPLGVGPAQHDASSNTQTRHIGQGRDSADPSTDTQETGEKKSHHHHHAGQAHDYIDRVHDHLDHATAHNKPDSATSNSATTATSSNSAGPAEAKGTQVVDKPIVVKPGETFDGKGVYFKPSSAMGDGSQNEHQKPIFILGEGATLKNVQYSGGDGIHLLGSARLDNVVNRQVGEDAITIDGEKNRAHDARIAGLDATKSNGPANVEILNSSFYHGRDKIIQDNGNANVTLRGVTVDGAGKVFRTNGGQPITSNVTIADSTFKNVKEAIFRTDSQTSKLHLQGHIDTGDLRTVALTPNKNNIDGTDKIGYKSYSG